MTNANIFVFALAALALVNVALGFLIWTLRRDVESLRGTASTFERRFVNTAIKLGELTKASPVNLAAEVVSLAESVARLKATHQRFQGRFDQYVTQQIEQPDPDDDAYLDPKFAALMRAQGMHGNGGT